MFREEVLDSPMLAFTSTRGGAQTPGEVEQDPEGGDVAEGTLNWSL